jgi:small-conductance mechanosensitive channel
MASFHEVKQRRSPVILHSQEGIKTKMMTFCAGCIGRLRFLRIVVALILALPLTSAFSQPATETSSPSGEEVLSFLGKTVVWYRQLSAQQQMVTGSSDVLLLNDNRQVAGQIVQLSFDFARARAQALSNQGNTAVSVSPQYQKLAEAEAGAERQVKKSQQELEGMRKKLDSASESRRRTLQATIAETESELELFQARRDALHSLLQAGSGNATGNQGGLHAQIEELARTVPIVAEAAGAVKEPGASANSPAAHSSTSVALAPQEHRAEPSGILALISGLFSLRRRIETLDDNLRLTESLAQSSKDLRTPLAARMRELTLTGNQLAAQPDATDVAVLARQKENLDGLTAQYKQLAATLLPLGKQSILLDVYRHSAIGWRNAMENQYQTELKGLLLRMAGLAVVLGLVFGTSELSRRATFRYVTDIRRRYQFLLLRRIVMWCLIAIIVAVTFASELGAITTFAGLLTAGIAVALQNVILSVAGYFFLIGKYGIRVGDRVQVAGITGDVVDIGLVRLHLMEVGGGPGSRPTGRVVAFSNGVVFQANAGMFKQIPGTNFLWHEVMLTLSPENDYHRIEQSMLNAVTKVLSEYHEPMEMQRRNMERALYSIRSGSFDPESRVRLTPSGLEVAIRYPVELSHAAEIDDRITRELLETIGHEPSLRIAGTQIAAQSA